MMQGMGRESASVLRCNLIAWAAAMALPVVLLVGGCGSGPAPARVAVATAPRPLPVEPENLESWRRRGDLRGLPQRLQESERRLGGEMRDLGHVVRDGHAQPAESHDH